MVNEQNPPRPSSVVTQPAPFTFVPAEWKAWKTRWDQFYRLTAMKDLTAEQQQKKVYATVMAKFEALYPDKKNTAYV
ncbi:Translation initiation factor IF-2 [Frankliniella fusca]|uniref:Translation initiation factor IF-2 n=1 Tax=Frankliniella fusca TaxID=407009 RepID=A0AAE1LLU8_9NEOP|nr:Translation initiation factor IF-2 [Frankliniella fusca]